MYFVIVFILIMLVIWVNVVIQVMVVIVLTFRASIDSLNLNLSKSGRANPIFFKRTYFYCRLKSKQLKYGKMQSCKDLFLTQQTCHSISLLTNQHFGHGGHFGHSGHFGHGVHFIHVDNGGYLCQVDAKFKQNTMRNFWDLLITCHFISILLNQHFGHGGLLGHCSHRDHFGHSGHFGCGGHFVHVASLG